MEVVNACPHHGYEDWDIVNYFYDGLAIENKHLLESMCNGSFLHKSLGDAFTCLEKIAEHTRGCDEDQPRGAH